MKILVVSQQFYPEEFRVNEIVEELVNRGHEVDVLTGLPHYPYKKVFPEYKLFKNRKQTYKGAKVYRTFELARKDGVVGLVSNYFSFMISGTLKALRLKKNYDVVYCYQLTPVTMILPALTASKINKVPLFTYCLDIWPEVVKTIIGDRENIILKVADKISKFLYKRSDKIAVTSKPFIEYFTKHHKINENKLNYLPQHGEEYKFKLESIDNGITDFVFTGNIGRAQGLDVFLKAASMIKELDFKIHLVGEGSDKDRLQKITKELEIEDKVIFYGRRPINEMKDFYELADACLLSLIPDGLIGLTMPAKLQSYMSAGKYVLASIEGASVEVINESGCGVCVEASNVELVAKNMEKIVNMTRNQLDDIGQKGKEYFKKNFTLEKHIDELESSLSNLIIERES